MGLAVVLVGLQEGEFDGRADEWLDGWGSRYACGGVVGWLKYWGSMWRMVE